MSYKKCGVCGYEKGHTWRNDEFTEINPKGKDFIRIDGNFTTDSVGSMGFKRKIEVGLYACPECNTVIMKEI